jgi:hypothetical protein
MDLVSLRRGKSWRLPTSSPAIFQPCSNDGKLGRTVASLTFSAMSYIMYDMNVIVRDFIKRFSHFKRQAMTGSPVKLVDRDGRRFVFKMEKNSRLLGAGRHLSKGIPLSPEPVDRSEWKGLV